LVKAHFTKYAADRRPEAIENPSFRTALLALRQAQVWQPPTLGTTGTHFTSHPFPPRHYNSIQSGAYYSIKLEENKYLFVKFPAIQEPLREGCCDLLDTQCAPVLF